MQLPDYLVHVDRRLQQEMELLNNYLHKSTRYVMDTSNWRLRTPFALCTLCKNISGLCFLHRKPLILCVEKQLVGEHLEEILDKGMSHSMIFIIHVLYIETTIVVVNVEYIWWVLDVLCVFPADDSYKTATLSRNHWLVWPHHELSHVQMCGSCVSGYESLLEAIRIPDLALLYGFFMRFKNGLTLMSKAFANYIKVSIYTVYMCTISSQAHTKETDKTIINFCYASLEIIFTHWK